MTAASDILEVINMEEQFLDSQDKIASIFTQGLYCKITLWETYLIINVKGERMLGMKTDLLLNMRL